MPTRIRVVDRIPIHIPKPIPGRRIHRIGDDGIRLGEGAGHRIIEASAVVIQPNVRVPALVGEEAVG